MTTCECGCGRVPNTGKRYVHGHQVGRGPNHMNWAGGVSYRSGGYRSVLQADGSHKLEHIVVAERTLGKPLPKGAHVHHVNGDAGDNRPENLVVCENSAYHNMLHRRQRAYDATGNANAYPCVFCQSYARQDEMTVIVGKNRRTRAYHKPCNTRAARHYRATRRSA